MFEFLFKYPATIFHKGQFVLLAPWPVWTLLLAILAAAALLFWHVRRNHGLLSGLASVRHLGAGSGMVALMLFLLWHPALSVATLKPQQNVVAVLVDDSRSMSINDASRHAREQRESAARRRPAERSRREIPGAAVPVRQRAGAHPEDRSR